MTETLSLEDWQRWWKHNGNRELRDLLLVWWDPIGVYGVPEAVDEYDSYVGTIGRRLREGAREDGLVEALRDAEQHITVAGDADTAARKVVEWHDHVMTRMNGQRA